MLAHEVPVQQLRVRARQVCQHLLQYHTTHSSNLHFWQHANCAICVWLLPPICSKHFGFLAEWPLPLRRLRFAKKTYSTEESRDRLRPGDCPG